jgi:hypothetical protein
MELMESTRQARLLTRQLNMALDGQDMEMWLELLELREAAMVAFDKAHRAADSVQRESCREDIVGLKAEDHELQDRSENLLEKFAGEFREQVGSSSYGGNNKDMSGRLACLDRKA